MSYQVSRFLQPGTVSVIAWLSLLYHLWSLYASICRMFPKSGFIWCFLLNNWSLCTFGSNITEWNCFSRCWYQSVPSLVTLTLMIWSRKCLWGLLIEITIFFFSLQLIFTWSHACFPISHYKDNANGGGLPSSSSLLLLLIDILL